MNKTPLETTRACFRAYVEQDRAALEALLDDNYHFTSPLDNELDRQTYLKVCWPNSAAIASFDLFYETEDGDRAFVVYEGRTTTGKRFRNCEVHIVNDGKLVATEVYFGWDLPHRARLGGHVNH
jgi:ketosteroid isomerase-like protein